MRAGLAGVPPVDVVVAGLEQARVRLGSLEIDMVEHQPRKPRRRRRVADVQTLRHEQRDGRRPHRLEHDLVRGHQVDGLVERRPEGPELALLLQVEEDLDDAVDLLLGHVAERAERHHAGRLRRVPRVLKADPRVVEERDAALIARVEQLGPVDVGGLFLDDVAVVAHRVHVEVVRRADRVQRLVAHGLAGLLVDPGDEQVGELARGLGRGVPVARLVGIDVERAERGVAVAVGARRRGADRPCPC